MNSKSRQIIGRLHDAYESALKYVAGLMTEHGIHHLELRYTENNLPPAFDVNVWDGISYPIDALSINPEKGYGLIARDAEGTEFPIGLHLEDQDNYTVFGLTSFVMAAEKAVEEVTAGCIEIKLDSTREDIIKGIRNYIGRFGETEFWKEFPLPLFRQSCIEEDHITAVTDRDARIVGYEGKNWRVLLDNMTRKELAAVAKGLNDYRIFLHNHKYKKDNA